MDIPKVVEFDLALALAFRFLGVVHIVNQWDFIWVSRALETHLSFGIAVGVDGVTFGSPNLSRNPVRIPKSRTYYALASEVVERKY
jgi:hypothetical protein